MHIAILTFDGFNEIDSVLPFAILKRVKKADWRVSLAAPTPYVTSMNGMRAEAHIGLAEAMTADAVLVGSGMATRAVVKDEELMAQLSMDPQRQLVGAQCSGALVLAKLGLLNKVPACTDLVTKPWVQEAGCQVLDQPFYAKQNLATAGGCLASPYLAAWTIARLAGRSEAEAALHYVAPVGEKDLYVERAMAAIGPYLDYPAKETLT